MKLYTIIMTFEDLSEAIEQLRAPTPFSALEEFVKNAESLDGFNREHIQSILSTRERAGQLLLPLAGKVKGVWQINLAEYVRNLDDTSAILGGNIIQTDIDGL